MKQVTFKHLVSGKPLTVFNPKQNLLGIIHGPMEKDKSGIERVWLIVSNVPTPLAIEESYEETITKIEGEK